MTTDLTGLEVVLVIASVFAGALVKSVTGMGFPLVAIPVMTLFLPTPVAVAVIALPNIAQNLVLVVRHRSAWRRTRSVAVFCAAGVPGAVIGAIALGSVPESVVRGVLIVALGAYLATTIATPDFRISDARAVRWSGPAGFLAGVFQGCIGISGPVVGTWYHGMRLTQDGFVLSVATVFSLTGIAQASVLGARGEFDGRLLVALALTVVVFATVPIGEAIRKRISVDRFRTIVLWLLAGSGASLIVDLVRRLT